MKIIVSASKKSKGLSDKDMGFIVDDLENALRLECEKRGKDEYVDDTSWNNFGCRIPIFMDYPVNNPSVSRLPYDTVNVATFEFHYDPDDEDYDAEEQAHVQLDEFLQEWNYSDEDEDDEEDYVGSRIHDVVEEYMNSFEEGSKEFNEAVDDIIEILERPPYNFVLDDTFDRDEVEYELEYFWNE